MVIDISEWQVGMDYSKLKLSGVDGVIVRAGHASASGDWKCVTDKMFDTHMQGITKAGLPLGAYWFSYATNAEQARREADYCCDLLKKYNITMPVFYDFEGDSISSAKRRGVNITKSDVTAMTVAFCDRVKEHGYRAGTYFNYDWYNRMEDIPTYKKKGYVLWLAQYNTKPSVTDGIHIWQYTSSGRISAYNGNLDCSNILDDVWSTKYFRPDKYMTRAEVIQVLWARCGKPKATISMPYNDVKSGVWYESALRWATEKGIVSGYEDGSFRPNSPVTRAQYLQMLWRISGSPVITEKTKFTDVSDTAYYTNAVRWGVKYGITSGTSETTFSPNKEITRGQAVTMLWVCAGRPQFNATRAFADVDSNKYYAVPIAWAYGNGYVAGY